jgi:hypothetical protein
LLAWPVLEALQHPGDHRPAAEVDAENVDLEDVPPVGGIDLPRFLLANVAPSVCDEEVDRPQLSLHLVDHRLDGDTVGDVRRRSRGHRSRARPPPPDRGSGR